MKLLQFIFLAIALTAAAFAQQATDLAALTDARQARIGLAADVAAARRDATSTLALIKQRRISIGVAGDADWDLGMAAADVGERILSSSAPQKADAFFRAAEVSLGTLIQRTSDPTIKAMALVRRAQIRSQYLDKKSAAAADMDQAAALRPDDPYIKSWRDRLQRRDAAVLQALSQSKR